MDTFLTFPALIYSATQEILRFCLREHFLVKHKVIIWEPIKTEGVTFALAKKLCINLQPILYSRSFWTYRNTKLTSKLYIMESNLLLVVCFSDQAVVCAPLHQAGVRFRFIFQPETFGWPRNILEQFSIVYWYWLTFITYFCRYHLDIQNLLTQEKKTKTSLPHGDCLLTLPTLNININLLVLSL